jgi:molybdopterin synthase sulfur carrier subunit
MRVFVPTPLRSYTGGRDEVSGSGATLGELLVHLDRNFPGMRFRMIDEQDRVRVHIRLFVNREPVRDLAHRLADGDEVQILCALSGG